MSLSNEKISTLLQEVVDTVVKDCNTRAEEEKALVKEIDMKEEKDLPKKTSRICSLETAVKAPKGSAPKKKILSKRKKFRCFYENRGTHSYSSPYNTRRWDDFLLLMHNARHPSVASVSTSASAQKKSVKNNYENTTFKYRSVNTGEIVATSKRIGFLGLGMIGQRMVKNLLNSNHNVTVWNRSLRKCGDYWEIGAHIALTPAHMISDCDIVFCCVSDSAAVKDIVYGKFGILSGLHSCRIGNKAYVELTSIEPALSIEIADSISSEGGKYLEAPVSGSIQDAAEKMLTIVAAGDFQLFKDCESCFAAISERFYFIANEVGTAIQMNIILSSLKGTTCAALAESISLVERSGLHPGTFLDVLSASPLSSALLNKKGQLMVARNFDASNTLKYQQNNINMALAMGNNVQQRLMVTSAANEVYKHARRLHYSDHDISAVLLGMEKNRSA